MRAHGQRSVGGGSLRPAAEQKRGSAGSLRHIVESGRRSDQTQTQEDCREVDDTERRREHGSLAGSPPSGQAPQGFVRREVFASEPEPRRSLATTPQGSEEVQITSVTMPTTPGDGSRFLEISGLTGKRHDNVLATQTRCWEALSISALKFEGLLPTADVRRYLRVHWAPP